MAHESFEDEEVAQELNEHFVSIKVDKEERPDIDSVYMAVCLLLTGSGGWPTSIFMTPRQKPFYAGTYFPKKSTYGGIGFLELLQAIHAKWEQDKESLLEAAEEITRQLQSDTGKDEQTSDNFIDVKQQKRNCCHPLAQQAVSMFRRSFDEVYGGFGTALKFPTPHNLMFLMEYYKVTQEKDALAMAEKTLIQIYRGGLFDHIGFGFSRYSSDERFLVPHFEKMLYDNALLMMTYAQAFAVTGKEIYQKIAEQTAQYVLREMTAPEGGLRKGVSGRAELFSANLVDCAECTGAYGLRGKRRSGFGKIKGKAEERRRYSGVAGRNPGISHASWQDHFVHL